MPTLSRFLRHCVVVATILCAGAGCTRQDATARPTVAIFNLLSYPILDESVAGIKEGLAQSGYDSARVRLIEVNANGEMDKVPAFARQLLASSPNVIVPVSTPVTQAVTQASPATQQIVFSTVTNPADVGMDRKPPNMTGVSDAVNYEANIALIKELFPQARTIGIVYNPGEQNSQFGVQEVQRLAQANGLTVRLATVSRSDEVMPAARALAGSVDCFYVGSDNTVVGAIAGLLRVAAESKKPVIASDQGSVKEGALAAVSVDYHALGERVGGIVAEVLRTGKPAGTIPPVRFVGNKLVLNDRAASTLGFTFPATVRGRANEIIR